MSKSGHPTPHLRWRWLLPAAAAVVAFHFVPFGASALNRAFFDTASRHPSTPPPLDPGRSALVMINDETMAFLGREPYRQRWPFGRAYFAALLAALDRAGAKKIIVDFTFLEQSTAADEDALLGALAAGMPKVVLAAKTDVVRGQPVVRMPFFWDESFRAAHPALFQSMRTGLADFPSDTDGVARKYEVPGSLAAAAFGETTEVGGLLRWHGGLQQIQRRGVSVVSAWPFFAAGLPIVERLSQKVTDFSPEAFGAALAAEPPLTGEPGGKLAAAIARVRHRVVFVGANASGTFDQKPLVAGTVEPGLLLHWTAWTNLEAGGFVKPLPHGFALALAAVVSLVVVGAASLRPGLLLPGLVTAVLIAALFGGAYVGISHLRFFPPATPGFAAVLTLLGIVTENFWAEQARKREIQSMFGAYVDRGVVDLLIRNPDAIRLHGEKREATVFFSDLAGFTDLSEKLKDAPETMVEIVNAYLEETSDCLLNHGAYVDKYIGDAVMAVFGVPAPLPDHALAACLAALEAQKLIGGINARYAARHGVKLAVRIGLNTGELIVGNVGSSRKRNYTVMGDTVNLASRLEGANKAFGTHTLVGDQTARQVRGRIATRPLARLQVKGKHEAVEVHTLVGVEELLSDADRLFLAAYRRGYDAFVSSRFAEAAVGLAEADRLAPGDITIARLRAEAEAFVISPPASDWQPVLKLDSK
ncbi:MAG TPA: adenylate/guanylate cyclase domain-containing protein [Candidatus Didemnitutus sp.]